MAEVAAFQGIGNRVSGYHPLTKVSGAGAISNNPFLFDPGSCSDSDDGCDTDEECSELLETDWYQRYSSQRGDNKR